MALIAPPAILLSTFGLVLSFGARDATSLACQWLVKPRGAKARALAACLPRCFSKPSRATGFRGRTAESTRGSLGAHATFLGRSQIGRIGETSGGAGDRDWSATWTIMARRAEARSSGCWWTQASSGARPRATWSQLLIPIGAANNTGGTRVREVQILDSSKWKIPGDTLCYAQPTSGWRGEPVMQCAAFGKMNGAAATVRGRIAQEKCLVEQRYLGTVDLDCTSIKMCVI
mmetsp:Transcript_87735/g.263810  ORF Transcript_87735/g.263810 Transcript_87735/m.263810 type:complete len:231 (-) Transcript_87735:680-1372(-)